LHRVSKTIGSQWISVSWGALVTVLLLLFLARKLGPQYLAIYLYLQAIASLYAMLQDGGFQVLVFREEIAPSRQTGFSASVLVRGYFGYVLLSTLLGIGIVQASPLDYKAGLSLAIICSGFKCVLNLVSSILKGRGNFEKEAFWKVRVTTVQALSVILVAEFAKPTPQKVFLSLIIAQLLLLATRQARTVLPWPRLAFPPWRLWKTSLAFTIIAGATSIYFRSDIVLLRHLQPDLSLVGNYGAAFQILDGIILFATPIVHICFRHLRLSWRDAQVFLSRLGKIITAAFLSAVVIVAMGVRLAPQATALAYGKEFVLAGEILPLLLLSLLFLLPNYILTQAAIALNLERYYAVAACVCAAFNLGTNFFLIPRYMAIGAAWSTVATEGLLMLLLGYRLLRWRQLAIREATLCEAEEEKGG